MNDMKVEYPPFSVLMSVYKKENANNLDLALKSIEDQTVVPNEIVLVEDGPISTKLKEVIIKHKNKFGKGFKDIISEKNHGLGAALRLGTNYVSTDWIARMDSDDISVPNRFELQLKEIVNNPNTAVIGGQIEEFANDPSNIIGYRRVPTSEHAIRQFVKWRSPFNHPSVMINKKALLHVGGYIPYGNLEDYYLWARILVNNYPVANLNQTLDKMRVDEGMYQRRGKISNINYFHRLRSFLYQNKMLSWREKIIGDWLMTLNILVPSWVRKAIYQRILHKK